MQKKAEQAVAVLLVVLAILGQRNLASGFAAQPDRATQDDALYRCSQWNQQRLQSQSKTLTGSLWTGYRFGIAHGISMGLIADPLSVYTALTTSTDMAKLDGLQPYYPEGLVAVLSRPPVLIEAFDAKCSDYRNGSVMLDALSLIAMGAALLDRRESRFSLYFS